MNEEKLLHLLRKKKGFCEAILDLAHEEDRLPIKEWISVLEQKKILLSCIEEIDSEIKPFKQALHMVSQEITDELEHTRKIIQQILHLDTRTQEKRKKELRSDES